MNRFMLAVALAILAPATSHAQSRPYDISLRGFLDAGATVFNASQSFKAVLGRPSGVVIGGGVEVGLTPRVFLSLAASRFHRSGHRVFTFEGQVFDLNVPTEIRVTPLELTGAYRFRRPNRFNRRTLLSRLEPYAGGGIGWHRYSETSTDAAAGEDVAQTFTGYHVLGGIEMPLRPWLAGAAEAQWSSVPNALGSDASAVSSVYGEHDLGGFTVRVKLVIGR